MSILANHNSSNSEESNSKEKLKHAYKINDAISFSEHIIHFYTPLIGEERSKALGDIIVKM